MSDLDDALRTMLRERASDIAVLPADFLDLASLDTLTFPDERPHQRYQRIRSGWLIAAAAACVALVAAALIVVDHHTGSAPPAQKPTGTHTAPAKVAVPVACVAALPGAWAHAYHASVLPAGGRTTMPLSVTATGDVLALRDAGPVPGSPRDVVLLHPGAPPRVMYRVPTPDSLSVQAADLSGPYLVIALKTDGRHPKGTIGNGPDPNVHRLIVIDTRTNGQKVLAHMTASQESKGTHQINQSFVLDGSVYWDEKPTYASTTGVIRAYDLATGAQRIAYSGRLDYPSASAAGVGSIDGNGNGALYVALPLPRVVQHAVPHTRMWTLVSDGTAYAWTVTARDVGWWRPGMAAPKYIRLPALPDDQASRVDAVSGSFVAVTGDDSQLLDMSTGALAPLSSPGLFDKHTRGSAAQFGRGPVFAGYSESPAGGHYVDGYWADAPIEVLRVDTSALPHLDC